MSDHRLNRRWSKDDQIAVVSVNGYNYTQFDTLRIERDLKEAASLCEMTITEASYGSSIPMNVIYTGVTLTATLNGQLAFTGRVSIRKVSYDANSHTTTIIAISGSQELTSSVPIKQGTYDGQSLKQTMNSVLQNISLNFTTMNDNGVGDLPFTWNVPHYGETYVELANRLCNARGLFLTTNVSGDLVAHLVSPNSGGVTTLTEGVDIISASLTEDCQFTAATVLATAQTRGNDTNNPRQQTAMTSQSDALSGLVNLFVIPHPLEADQAKHAAEHENRISNWPSFDLEVTVFGWQNAAGQLWDPLQGIAVTVISPMLFPDAPYTGTQGQLYLQRAEYRQDANGGSTTTLTLKPEGLLTNASGALAGGGGGGGSGAPDPNDAPATNPPPDDQAQTGGSQPAPQTSSQTDQKQASNQKFPMDAVTGQDIDSDDDDSNGTTST